MPLDKKGEEILQKVDYQKIREAIIEGVMRRISKEGTHGGDVRPLIEETLKEEHFSDFIKKLVGEIRRKTSMDQSESEKSASYLIQEDLGPEIARHMDGEMEIARPSLEKEEKEIHKKGEKEKLWREAGARRFLGKRTYFFGEIWQILNRHFILKVTVLTGIIFLIISALLFGSFYKAVLVGLTLTAFLEEPLYIKVANLVGGIGGILIFFTSISLLLQYFLVIKSRDEEIRGMARRYLERKNRE